MPGACDDYGAGACACEFSLGLSVRDREARADCECGELIDRVAAGTPVRKLLFIEAIGHTRLPFAGYGSDHRAGIELATIDAHRAAEAAADLERRLDDVRGTPATPVLPMPVEIS